MKEILGSIAAAALLGIGCAHGQKGEARAEVPAPQDTSPSAAQASPGSMTLPGPSALSCTVIRPGASTTQRSQSLQEDSGTGGSAAPECVPAQPEENPSFGQSSTGQEGNVSGSAVESTGSQPSVLDTDTGVGGAGNAEVDDNPAPMQPGQQSIDSAIQQDSAIVPPATRTERDTAAPDVVSGDVPSSDEGTGGAGNTEVNDEAAPSPSSLDAVGGSSSQEGAPAAPQMAPAGEPASKADTQFQDTGMGGAGSSGVSEPAPVDNTQRQDAAAGSVGSTVGKPAPVDNAQRQDAAMGSAGSSSVSKPAPAADTQFQDTGMGGAGGGGG
jgi:hypothetical protein